MTAVMWENQFVFARLNFTYFDTTIPPLKLRYATLL